MRPEYLYLHVPFCARRCPYCDFAVQATRRPPVAEWLDAVEAELRLLRAAEGRDEPLRLRTIYVGGGTPSLLGAGAMGELRRHLERHAEWDAAELEWTAEANPESFDAALAEDWRAAGVNRISLGVQTFSAEGLRWMGRLHGPEGPARAMEAARRAGIGNVSVDLIFGLPDRLGRDWGDDLERALSLEPEHVSLYGLTAEPGAALGRWVREGRERMPDDERYRREYMQAVERLGAAGFRHYEVSNFALPGRESVHNSAYWTGAAYLGLGPSAHSFQPPVRRWNLRGWEAYRKALEEGRLPEEDRERVDGAGARLERSWLALRTAEGLLLPDPTPAQRRLVEGWVLTGWAEWAGNRLRLTAEGWLLLDRLVVELDDAADVGRKAVPAAPAGGPGTGVA